MQASEAGLQASEAALRAVPWAVRWAQEQTQLGHLVEVRDTEFKGEGLFACGVGVSKGTELLYYGEVLT